MVKANSFIILPEDGKDFQKGVRVKVQPLDGSLLFQGERGYKGFKGFEGMDERAWGKGHRAKSKNPMLHALCHITPGNP